MRLKNIKLAGFKSFVDPTVVPFPSNLSAIVGPNGCGKSNIIDAVRWVMGESSAKQLRGESLDDVIFNGSATRKPLGQASIELNFDNSEGRLVGPYAAYSEIVVRREITRDGQSTYFLNNTRCRRRDITDLFLGTGLGPRSYAIIEQGMISRVIEAKPEDLRAYLEEAAGISKYKERRHETELRIQHTEENLARLNDIREELGKQLNHLQRQANAAEKYTILKQQERLLKAQIQALKWRTYNEQLSSHSSHISEQENTLIEATAIHQQLEQELEQQREQQNIVMAQHSEVQERYYQIGGEIARLEQALQHQQERNAQWQREQAEIEQNQQLTEQQLIETEERCAQLSEELIILTPQTDEAQHIAEQTQHALIQAEQTLQDWQSQWDTFNRETAHIEQRSQVENTRIQHLEQHLQMLEQRIVRLQEEVEQQTQQTLTNEAISELEQQYANLQAQQQEIEENLQSLIGQIAEQREQNKHYSAELDDAKYRLQTLSGQQASLEALQKNALGQQEETLMKWLQQHQLAGKQRLAQVLQVEAGWESAVETVLEKYLQAVCLEDFTDLDAALNNLPKVNLSLIASDNTITASSQQIHSNLPFSKLMTKVQAPYPLTALLSNIYITETLAEALQHTKTLAVHESIITRDGTWLGNNWLSVAHKGDAKTGVLQRERELNELKDSIAQTRKLITELQQQLEAGQTELRNSEQHREMQQQKLSQLIKEQAELRAQQQVQQARLVQTQQRVQQIHIELQDCQQLRESDQLALTEARNAWQEASKRLEQQTAQRAILQQAKTDYQAALDTARQRANNDRNNAHQLALKLQASQLQLETAKQNQIRLQQQINQLQSRHTELLQTISTHETPLTELTQQLENFTEQRNIVEIELNNARQQLEIVAQELRLLEQKRHNTEQQVNQARSELEHARLSAQELQVRCKTLQEQVAENDHAMETLLNELPEEANDAAWEEELAQTTRKIERLGPINLAAVDEFNTLSERKNYLDAQNTDLTEALENLQSVMRKIDQETRTRFKETFDLVNSHFQNLFPRLFGGGRASLDIDENDLLATGISVMAQPPGKRNSTIHLLSGGEKALTATALVFSLFQLNPAPFCILDEVDAPLDDANVLRFCNLVKEMSDKVQFIFISHNKLAIEMAQHLAGVTMQEAGASRLVAVDIDEAITMASA